MGERSGRRWEEREEEDNDKERGRWRKREEGEVIPAEVLADLCPYALNVIAWDFAHSH